MGRKNASQQLFNHPCDCFEAREQAPLFGEKDKVRMRRRGLVHRSNATLTLCGQCNTQHQATAKNYQRTKKVRRLERVNVTIANIDQKNRGQKRLEKNTCCHLEGCEEKICHREKSQMTRNPAANLFLSETVAATWLNKVIQKVNQGHKSTEQSKGKDWKRCLEVPEFLRASLSEPGGWIFELWPTCKRKKNRDSQGDRI